MHVADVHSTSELKPTARQTSTLSLEKRLDTLDVRTMWVKKRLHLEALNEEALAQSIGTFEQALRARSGTIVRLERARASSKRQIVVLYALPIERN